MKSIAFAIALTLGGAAVAQTYNDDTGTSTNSNMNTNSNMDMNNNAQTNMTTDMSTTTPSEMAMNGTVGPVVQPGNENPERDARGIPVISAPAIVPPGWNGRPAGAAMGGPLVDPTTGEVIDDTDNYPPCTATVTDNCLQAYAMRR